MTATQDQHDEALNTKDRLLRLFLTLVGVADLLAIVVVFLPEAWLVWAHEAVGLGSFPQGRIVGYLARSTSLLYGIHGAMLLVLAGDVVHYRALIRWYGRVIAIAGLLQNNITRDVEKLPGLGELPVLGGLFRSDRFQRNETELVIIVTPYIVRPVASKRLASPTDGLKAPNDVDRLWRGKTHKSGLKKDKQPVHGRGAANGLAGPAGFVLD
mgnify:CR=1 FL=1